MRDERTIHVRSSLRIRRGGRLSGLQRRILASHREHASLPSCASATSPPLRDQLLPCFMAASLLFRRPQQPWQHELAQALLDDRWWQNGKVVPPALSALGGAEALARAAALRREELDEALSDVRRWHLETQVRMTPSNTDQIRRLSARLPVHLAQDRLFGHLRDDRPRTMLDVGCHAHAGRFLNVSDALIWLDYFNASGGLVVGLDALEDFALDLQHRFDHAEPYAGLRAVSKRALFLAAGIADNVTLDLFYGVAKPMMFSCTNGWHERWRSRDHHCRIPQHRLGMLDLGRPPPVSSHPHALFETLRRGNTTRRRWTPYLVHQMRLDTLWAEQLGGRHIDFLKVDVDQSWRRLGFERLITQRAVSVMTLEIDESWGSKQRPRPWGVSDVDQLVWFASQHSYASFLKVPCRARTGRDGRFGDPAWAAWYWPLGNSSSFVPSVATSAQLQRKSPHLRRRRVKTEIQDMLVVDERSPGLVDGLRRLARSDCRHFA